MGVDDDDDNDMVAEGRRVVVRMVVRVVVRVVVVVILKRMQMWKVNEV